RAMREGRQLRGAVPTSFERAARKATSWLAALRLQFYPTTWLVYTLGATAAAGASALGSAAYWLGYVVLFFVEAATVLTNEVCDYSADRGNRRYGPFNGGSRVIIDGLLTRRELLLGAAAAAAAAVVSAFALVAWTGVAA